MIVCLFSSIFPALMCLLQYRSIPSFQPLCLYCPLQVGRLLKRSMEVDDLPRSIV
jgi:hypothetical protein